MTLFSSCLHPEFRHIIKFVLGRDGSCLIDLSKQDKTLVCSVNAISPIN